MIALAALLAGAAADPPPAPAAADLSSAPHVTTEQSPQLSIVPAPRPPGTPPPSFQRMQPLRAAPTIAAPARPVPSQGQAVAPPGVARTAPATAAPSRPASPQATAPRPAAGRPTRDQVLAAVRAEWPTYDTRRQGRLGPLEFGTWVMRANGAAVQPAGARRDTAGVKPVTAMNVTARAFAEADANHDGGVSPEELTAFLMR